MHFAPRVQANDIQTNHLKISERDYMKRADGAICCDQNLDDKDKISASTLGLTVKSCVLW